ncbi:hypothetical protein V8C86DRAFT_2752759, partial [Haematococcus lacustris]
KVGGGGGLGVSRRVSGTSGACGEAELGNRLFYIGHIGGQGPELHAGTPAGGGPTPAAAAAAGGQLRGGGGPVGVTPPPQDPKACQVLAAPGETAAAAAPQPLPPNPVLQPQLLTQPLSHFLPESQHQPQPSPHPLLPPQLQPQAGVFHASSGPQPAPPLASGPVPAPGVGGGVGLQGQAPQGQGSRPQGLGPGLPAQGSQGVGAASGPLLLVTPLTPAQPALPQPAPAPVPGSAPCPAPAAASVLGSGSPARVSSMTAGGGAGGGPPSAAPPLGPWGSMGLVARPAPWAAKGGQPRSAGLLHSALRPAAPPTLVSAVAGEGVADPAGGGPAAMIIMGRRVE